MPQLLDYDIVFAFTSFWHAEIFDYTTGESMHWTAGFADRQGAIAAAEAFLAAQETAEERP